jgi:hypothetical protein
MVGRYHGVTGLTGVAVLRYGGFLAVRKFRRLISILCFPGKAIHLNFQIENFKITPL